MVLYKMRRDHVGLMLGAREKLGDAFVLNLLGLKVTTLLGPTAMSEVAMNREKAFSNAGGWEYFLGRYFERGLLLLDDDEHLHHRRIMQSAFARDKLAGYSKMMVPVIDREMETWPNGDIVRAHELLKRITLSVALEAFVGVELPSTEANRINKAFLAAIRGSSSFVRKPVPFTRAAAGVKGRKVLEEFFADQLAKKRRMPGNDLFSALCEAEDEEGRTFTDRDVINHMAFLLFAAHDTTTTALTSSVYYLAKNPEWQERAREASAHLGRDVGFDQLDELTTIDMIAKEALRLCPPVPALLRRATKDTTVNGYRVPKGSYILAHNYVNHILPDVWHDPTTFDPERFGERREDKSHRFAWSPFGGGVHKCIGMHFAMVEVKMVLHRLLSDFRWSVPSDYVWPLDLSVLPLPKDDLPVRLHRLDNRSDM
jgi:cytochrome P450